MPTVEVSRTLVKSPPELWSELSGERLTGGGRRRFPQGDRGGTADRVGGRGRQWRGRARAGRLGNQAHPHGDGRAGGRSPRARRGPDGPLGAVGRWPRSAGPRRSRPRRRRRGAAKTCRRRSSSCSTTWAPPTAGRSRTADASASVSLAVTAVPDPRDAAWLSGRRCVRRRPGAGRRGAARAADRPNVIVIVVDTLRADHVYGDRARTPNMDALRREGISFTSAYPEALPTVPVRNTLLSGRRQFPFRGWHDWRGLLDSPGWAPLTHVRSSWTSALRRAGYFTAYVTDNPFLGFSTSLPAAEAQLPPLRAHRRRDRRPAHRRVAPRAAPLDAPRAASRREGVRAHAPLPLERPLLARRGALVRRAGVRQRRPDAQPGGHAAAVRPRARHLRATRAVDAAAQVHQPLRGPRPPRAGAGDAALREGRQAGPGATRRHSCRGCTRCTRRRSR